MKRLEKKLQKTYPDRRSGGSSFDATQFVSPVAGLEKRLAVMEKLYEEQRNENDRLRQYMVSPGKVLGGTQQLFGDATHNYVAYFGKLAMQLVVSSVCIS